MMSKQNILILGGTGAMGMSLVSILAADLNNEIVVTTRSRRDSAYENVTYIKGNAMDNEFMNVLLRRMRWDAIVDFMSYDKKTFSLRYNNFLDSTRQYVFISSARVYAPSNGLLTENSPRLLDICTNADYMKTEEYALSKAMQEDLLYKSGNKNYTVVRPSLTYNNERLQFALYEKEGWLGRYLRGKQIVFPENMKNLKQTFSHGEDVAKAIAKLIGNEKAMGETTHIAGAKAISWGGSV